MSAITILLLLSLYSELLGNYTTQYCFCRLIILIYYYFQSSCGIINTIQLVQTTLRVRDLPANICDPDLQSSFAPPIRRACAEFPLIAERVMRRNGLGAEEFNELQQKLDRNPFFRFQVQQEIKKLKSY